MGAHLVDYLSVILCAQPHWVKEKMTERSLMNRATMEGGLCCAWQTPAPFHPSGNASHRGHAPRAARHRAGS
ncbi:hypothetical protein, partial [Hydrogenophaga sp. A37]|uniref:hypothetical protein n=1 Tax=Hydrogenophaga sp. A37 TaxID=1945864 RepID=UPI001C0D5180